MNTAMFGVTSYLKPSKYLHLKGANIEHTFNAQYVTVVIDAGSTTAVIILEVKKRKSDKSFNLPLFRMSIGKIVFALKRLILLI